MCACRPDTLQTDLIKDDYFQWRKRDNFTIWMTSDWHRNVHINESIKYVSLKSFLCAMCRYNIKLSQPESLIHYRPIVTLQWSVSCNKLGVGQATKFVRSKNATHGEISFERCPSCKCECTFKCIEYNDQFLVCTFLNVRFVFFPFVSLQKILVSYQSGEQTLLSPYVLTSVSSKVKLILLSRVCPLLIFDNCSPYRAL